MAWESMKIDRVCWMIVLSVCPVGFPFLSKYVVKPPSGAATRWNQKG